MPIVFRANEAKYKSEATGEYVGFNVIGEVTTDELVAEINEAGETQVDNVEAVGATQVSAVNTAGATQLNAVNTAGATQVGNVNTAGTTQVNAVNQEGTTQVGLVNAEGATQVQAVEDKGAEVLESIPDDYEEKMDQVNDYLENLVVVSDTQPESESNKLWFDDQAEEEIEVPLYTEFEDVADAVDDLKNSLNLTTTYKTVSGDVASFDDGADNRRIRKIVGTIEPVQDLHGYDAPWPAGGGKNKIPDGNDASNGYLGGGHLNPDGTTTGASGWYVSEYFNVTPGESYTWSSVTNSAIGSASICFYDENKTYISGEKANGELPKTLVVPQNAVYCRASQSTVVSNICQLEVGTTATTPILPCSNVCQISGWTGANIMRTGKNLFNPQVILDAGGSYSEGVYSATQSQMQSVDFSYLKFKQNTQYYFYAYGKSNGTNTGHAQRIQINYTDGTTSYVSVLFCGITDYGEKSGTSTANKSIASIKFFPYGATVGSEFTKFMICEASDGTDYEAFKGITTLPINWQTEAGTIYGGTATLNEDGSADVVATRLYVKLNTLTWSYFSSAGYFRTSEASVANYSSDIAPLSEIYESALSISSSTPDMQIGWSIGSVIRLTVKDSRYTDVSLWLSAVGDYGTALYLKPENQTAYHFDNVGSLHSFLGTNNVWIDSGSITELIYNAGSNVAFTDKVNDSTTGLASKAPAIVNTVSGNVVSISDGAEGMPVKKIVGTIELVQDLHGYDAPWPAGGGKNLFNKLDLESDTNHYISDTGNFRVPGSGEYRVSNYIPVKAGSTYTLSNMQSSATTAVSMAWYTSDKTYIKSEKYLSATTSKTVTAPDNAYFARMSVEYSLLNICQFELGSTATAYAPYSNECPISGWNEAVLAIAESKIVPDAFAVYQGTITTAGGTQSNAYRLRSGPVEIVGGKTYTVYSNLPYIALRLYSVATTSSILPAADYNTAFQATPFTFTANQDATIVRFIFTLDTSTQVLITPTDFAYLNIFESGKGTQTLINWQDEAGTIYGGTVTLNEDGSADVVASWQADDMGALSYTKDTNLSGVDRFYFVASGTLDIGTTTKTQAICSVYKSDTLSNLVNASATNGVGQYHKTFYFFTPVGTYADATAFATAMDGQIICYPLATPGTPIHIPNVGSLSTYLGTNNVWIDTGSITKLDYSVDTGSALSVKQDKTKFVALSGTAVNITAEDNTMYLCGELAELTFTAPATGITAIRFTSGTTPTVATFNGVTWLNGFRPNSLDATRMYEINILNGVGVAAWT